MLQSASHWTPGLGHPLTLSRLHLRVEEGAPGPLHGSCVWLSRCGVWSPPHAPLRGAAGGPHVATAGMVTLQSSADAALLGCVWEPVTGSLSALVSGAPLDPELNQGLEGRYVKCQHTVSHF